MALVVFAFAGLRADVLADTTTPPPGVSSPAPVMTTSTPVPAPATTAPVAPASASAAPASPSASPSPPPKLLQFSGSADAGYTGVNGLNQNKVTYTSGSYSRIFDVHNNTLDLQNVNVQLLLTGPAGFGGKVEASFGTDADIIASHGTDNTDGFDLTNAYVSYATGPLTVEVGKFSTLAGAEVIEAPGNNNYSRSFTFGDAIPFTHTGVTAAYVVSPKLTIDAGVVNGWDDIEFTGKPLTGEFGLGINPSPAITISLVTYNGQDFTSGGVTKYGDRALYDGVLTVKATPALTLQGEYDNGRQLDAAGVGEGNAAWTGAILYGTYQLNPKYAVSLRGESFSDINGFRTGYIQTLHSETATLNFTPSTPLIFRLEYRLDQSTVPSFQYNNSPFGRANQNSIGLEAIFKY